MIVPNPKTSPPRNGRYEQFQAQTAGISFVKIPKDVLETTMHDELATHFQRVMAYIMRYSWGNYSSYAIHEDGTPRLQRDCAKELGIKKQAVSKAVRYGITRGYLQDELKILYPLLTPQLGNCKKVALSGDFSWATFMEQWKVANSTDFLTLQVARSTVKRIQKVALSDYKKWRTPATNGGASLYKIKEDLKTDPPPPQPSVKATSSREEEEENTQSIEPLPEPAALTVIQAIIPLPESVEPTVIEAQFVPEEPTFQEFAEDYPGEVDPDSKPAYDALTPQDRAAIHQTLPSFKSCERWKTPRFIPRASNFLKKRYWEFPPPRTRIIESLRMQQQREQAQSIVAALKRERGI